jgi:uncharacterized protein YjbI with pentapeptide repeats
MDSGSRSALTSTGNSNALNPTNVEIKLFDSLNGGKQIKTNADVTTFSTNANTFIYANLDITGNVDVSGELHAQSHFVSGTLVQLFCLNNMKIFTHQMFSRIQLPNQQVLSNANFAYSNLSFSNFKNSNLFGCNFTGANISSANFANANFTNTNFTDAIWTNETNVSNVILNRTLVNASEHYRFPNATLAQEISPKGNPIYGVGIGDQFGYSISLSSDGSILAAGSPKNSTTGDRSGQVRIFQNINNTWSLLGNALYGTTYTTNHTHDFFGYAVSLSSDGLTIAIGAPDYSIGSTTYAYCKVFQYNSNLNQWIQMGNVIGGHPKVSSMGTSIGLSANGTVVAIGDPTNTSLYLYFFQNSSWTLTHTITTGVQFGSSLSLSNNSVACGNKSGLVRVYGFNTNSYSQIGNPIQVGDGNIYSIFDKYISISSDGNVLAIARPGQVGWQGFVSVYAYNSSSSQWNQLGSSISSNVSDPNNNQQFTASISLSSNGTLLAIGCKNATSGGFVSLYKFNSSTNQWQSMYSNIVALDVTDDCGACVCLSGAGSALAIGAPNATYYPTNISFCGQVRMFGFESYLSN